ncbi:hypothetical protein WK41_19820 [Burkholderia cepacia]|nr:hypothetical protein WK41_19820 [Burkholderia cepacia]
MREILSRDKIARGDAKQCLKAVCGREYIGQPETTLNYAGRFSTLSRDKCSCQPCRACFVGIFRIDREGCLDTVSLVSH